MSFLRLLTITIFFLMFSSYAAAGNFCDLAEDVTEKAATAFSANRDDGLKLFIIARELCLVDPDFAYNLGVAYYRYGYLDEAQKSLEEAIQLNGSSAELYNNLAQVILERKGDAQQALVFAEHAVSLLDSPATNETLARVRFAAGEKALALEELNKMINLTSNNRLRDSYNKLFADYMADRINRLKSMQ